MNTGDQTTISGNAGTATALATARAINGVAFDGTAPITVTAAAGTLTGATLASGVTGSSLTSAAGGAFGSAAFISAASKLDTTNGVAVGLTSSTLSSIAPGSVVARQYLDYVGSTNLDNWMAIQTWGDSLTDGSGGTTVTNRYPGALALYSGFYVADGGVSGETSTQIRTRQTAGSNTWYQPTIIWAGRNNYTDTNAVIADIAAMVTNLWSCGNTNRYIVMSVLNGDYSTEWVGTTNYQTITNLNGMLSSIYGTQYFDIRSYLVSRYNPSLTNDVTDFGHDVPPASLRSDQIHLNDDGYPAVAAYILTNALPTLRGSWSSVANPGAVLAMMRSPGPIGVGTPNSGAFSVLSSSTSVTSETASLSAPNPIQYFNETDQASTNSAWRLSLEAKTLSLRIPDNLGGNNPVLTFARDGGTAGEAVHYGTGLTLVGSIRANGTDNNLRALHSASAGLYFPVFTADPSGIYRPVLNRTAAEVRSDIGAGTGSVTSVSATVPAFLSISGSPITTSGTLAISYSGTALPIANGGTGRTILGTGVDTANGLAMSGTGGFVGYTSPTIASPSFDSATISAANPILYFVETDQASTNSTWRVNLDAKTLSLRIPDNLGGNSPFMTFTRDGGTAGATVLYGSGLTLVGDIIANGVNSSLRASAAGTAGTYFPVWTADPSGVYQVIKNRTAAQVRSDIGAGTGSGTVTSVSVTTANGVSGSVATSTTTPAITLTLGAITPTSVAASSTVSGTTLTSTIATGTAPFTVASTTLVSNLNADRLDGLHKGGIQPASANLTNVAALTAQSLPSTIISVTENTQTGTTYTVLSTDNGKVVTLNNAAAITVTVPTLSAGFSCTFIQKGAGQVTFTTSGTTVSNAHSQTKTFGQYAAVTLYGLSSTTFVLAGDTGT